MTDESNIGIKLWIALIVGINVAWISMDLWLAANHHEYLTTEFKEGLRNPFWGPIVMGLVAFTAGMFLTHMLTNSALWGPLVVGLQAFALAASITHLLVRGG
jgi:hypothetical protein